MASTIARSSKTSSGGRPRGSTPVSRPRAQLHCVNCDEAPGDGVLSFCAKCGSFLDISYPLPQCALHESSNPYLRYRDLLPVKNMSLYPRAGTTPTVHASRLGRLLGMAHLYLKDETANPTGTTKDRMAAVSLPFLHEQGVRGFTTSSTGNSSTAYAHLMPHFPEMTMYVFTAQRFTSRVQYTDSPNIWHFILEDASFVDAGNYAMVFAQLNGLDAERGFFNPGRREGLKVTWLETCEQVEGPIDWYVQAISSAMGVYGVYKGAKELSAVRPGSPVPRLLCVQQESCAPMIRAWEEGSEQIAPHHRIAMPDGIAEAILRGDPTKAYPPIRHIVLESGGDMVSVSETEIREARRMVEGEEGLSPCFAASAAVAGLIKRVKSGTLPRSHRVVVNLTGSDRQPEATAPARAPIVLVREGGGFVPRDPLPAALGQPRFA